MRRGVPAVALFVLALAAASPAAAATRYTVAPHDTLYRIARRFGVPVGVLAQVNGLRDPSRLPVGLVLLIPDLRTPVRAPRPSRFLPPSAAVSTERPLSAAPQGPGASAPVASYVVSPKDTLFRIARDNGISVEDLRRANGLSSADLIRAGQSLFIPAPGRGVASPLRASPGPPPSSAPVPGRGELARRVVSIALRYLGTPYSWGGTGPGGVDCSGLVYLVYSPYLPHLPRVSYDQWEAGLPVDRSELAPGDLVFFDTDGTGASHVGIYVGGGRFVHPSAAAGRVVVDRLDEPYYASRYLGARRVL